MRTSKFTAEEIQVENAAREEAAYNAVKDCIKNHHSRFIGAVGDTWKVRRICTAKYIKGLDRPHSKVVEYLSVPTQTLYTLAGFYLRTSRKDPKRRIPVGPIIQRLEQEGIVRVVSGAKKSHRANVYLPGRAVLAELATVQKAQPTAQQSKPETISNQTTVQNSSSHQKIMEMDIAKFVYWVTTDEYKERVKANRHSVLEWWVKKVEEIPSNTEDRLRSRLAKLGIFV